MAGSSRSTNGALGLTLAGALCAESADARNRARESLRALQAEVTALRTAATEARLLADVATESSVRTLASYRDWES
jgi:hypothetical protein